MRIAFYVTITVCNDGLDCDLRTYLPSYGRSGSSVRETINKSMFEWHRNRSSDAHGAAALASRSGHGARGHRYCECIVRRGANMVRLIDTRVYCSGLAIAKLPSLGQLMHGELAHGWQLHPCMHAAASSHHDVDA